MNNTIEIKNDLSVVDYVTVVEAIASGFFDEDGGYTPHIGRLNAMRIFYNVCVTSTIADLPHDISEALQMEDLVKDAAFVEAYSNAIEYTSDQGLAFTNAYSDALDIVCFRKLSINQAVDAIKKMLTKLMDSITGLLSEDNLEKIEKLANELSSGNFNSQSILDAFGNSEAFNKTIGN